MLFNHPHIAAQLAVAHRDDLERQARSRRLRRFARAANRADRQAAAEADTPTTAAHLGDVAVAEAASQVIEPSAAPLPGPSR